MFSFHKPRVYRSVSGCCICRAKSSSSRFTDSKRYEDVFFECFKLSEDRSGEICNACVLLVKRWKKLPMGSQRNWKHVVDARAGHGSKPLSKINKVKKNKVNIKLKPINATLLKEEILADDRENDFQIPSEAAERMQKKLYIPQIKRNRVSSPSAYSDDIQLECLSSESGSYHSSLETSPVPSPVNVDDDEDSTSNCIDSSQLLNGNVDSEIKKNVKSKRHRSKAGLKPQKNRVSISSFLDLTFWKREKTCCGIVFKGPFGEVLIDRRFLNPCRSNPSSLLPSPQCETAPTVKGTTIDCFGIDSGYEHSTIESYRMLPNSVTGIQKDMIRNKMLVSPYVSNLYKVD